MNLSICSSVFLFQAPLIDILKYKMKNPQFPDPMTIRTVFEPIKSSPRFNSTQATKLVPNYAIGWEFFLLASSLITDQIFLFEDGSSPSANSDILEYMDKIVAAGKSF